MSRLLLACLLLGVSAPSIQVQVTPGASTNAPICPSRSINYITHSLPQQCLTTSWASKASPEVAANGELQTPNGSATLSSSTQTTTIASSTPQSTTSIDSASVSPSLPSRTEVTPSAFEASKKPDVIPEVDQESDSPLDNANFLSFEDWKRQNLAKAGQSAENLGARTGGAEPRRRPGGINHALDSLGEDTEIEIDFGGFVNPGSSVPTPSTAKSGTEKEGSFAKNGIMNPTTTEEASGVRRKGKDAGKTCKERSNYASFDCAATVLKTNPESKGSTAVLVENKDSYMLNICSAKNKFFIIELCDDILIDTVVLANFEFFSSMFRTFRVSVSDRYPVKLEKWKAIGTFEARNSRDVQAFLVENPLIWARYLRIEILTHFGNEYYCPVSLLRVHGTTMMEEFNHDLKRTGTEEENDIEAGENEEGEGVDSTSDVISAETLKEQAQKTSDQAEKTSVELPISTDTVAESPSQQADAAESAVPTAQTKEPSNAFAPHNFSITKQLEDVLYILDDAESSCKPEDEPPGLAESASATAVLLQANPSVIPTKVANATESRTSQTSTRSSSPVSSNETKFGGASNLPLPERVVPGNKTEQPRPSNQTSASAAKAPVSSTQPPNANPTTQESFFKSVHKRLQLLESNSTLSLQYIEEQSRILRDAFSKVEKRQLAKTTAFLETLNTTVLTELRDFRNQYDQIWQSTVLELSSQREQSQHEVFALSARLSLLADEIVFQKRIAIFQFILILLCLGLAIFSRSGSAATYLELRPLVQNAINRSPANLSRYAPHFETPPTSPSSTRPSSRYSLLNSFNHRRSVSEDSQPGEARDSTKGPTVEYFPPTPSSQGSPTDHRDVMARGEGEETSSDGSPQAIAHGTRQTKSSPGTPIRQREDQEETFGEGDYLRPNIGG